MSALSYLMAVTGFASILALFEMPYDFYVLLRGLVSISAVFLGVFAVIRGNSVWLVLAVPVFVLWFPLFGVTMDRGSWAVLNVLAAIGFILAWKKFDFAEKPSGSKP
jgi:hypothetical protein